MTGSLKTLYRAAIQAENDFQAAVVRQFGAKEAGDARYQYRTFNPATQRAHLKFYRSMEKYLAACQEERKSA